MPDRKLDLKGTRKELADALDIKQSSVTISFDQEMPNFTFQAVKSALTLGHIRNVVNMAQEHGLDLWMGGDSDGVRVTMRTIGVEIVIPDIPF